MKNSRTIEVTVLSAENLTTQERKPIKRNAFVVVKVDAYNHKSTKSHYEGGNNPKWNEKIVINMPLDARFIALEVHLANKIIGTACVSVSDFIGDYKPENCLHFLSYRLKDGKGKKNGILNVSVRVIGNDDANHGQVASAHRKKDGCDYGCLVSAVTEQPPVGVPVNCYGGTVVTGVPVWCASRA